MLPAPSVPIAAAARWAATAAPDPPDDPPGMREGSLGLRVVPVWGVIGRHPERQLVGVVLAEQDRAGIRQPPCHGRIARRDVVPVDRGPGSGADAGRVDEVLERDRDAVQGAPVPALGDLIGSAGGVVLRPLAGDLDVGAQARVQLVDAGQVVVGELDRGTLARREGGRRLAQREVGER
jgi:hypothetical protein